MEKGDYQCKYHCAITPNLGDLILIYQHGVLSQHFGIDVPFMTHLGLECISLSEDSCHTRLLPYPALLNSRGDIHGGALMSAFDFSLSVAARSHDPLGCGAATIDMSTHFYEPAKAAVNLIARCSRRGKRIAFCEAEAKDASGQVLAVARAVFRLVPPAP